MTVLPTCPFPVPFWWKLASGATVDVGEHYQKQTYRNRYSVLGVNGPITLTIPVESQDGAKISTKDIRIAEHGSWRRIHLGTLRSAYGKSSFFPFVSDAIEALYKDISVRYVVDFNQRSVEILSGLLGPLTYSVSTEFIRAEDISRDCRGLFDPATPLPGLPSYPQVFSDRFAYVSGLSVLDAAMNLGPLATERVLLLKID